MMLFNRTEKVLNSTHGDWLTGHSLYMDLQPLSACTNGAQREGWTDAQRTHYAALVAANNSAGNERK